MKNLRKPNAKYSKHLFLEEWNDIIFFIEDKDQSTKKVYKELLSNTFSDVTISNVFPLGGRIEVVNQCKKSHIEKKKEKAIYIIDGDLYILAGENTEIFSGLDELNNLFVLPRYCIENYLIEESAVLEILDEEDCIKELDILSDELSYAEWVANNNELFKQLYLNYAIACKCKCGVPTISYSINRLVSSDLGELDSQKVQNRINEVKVSILGVLDEDMYEEMSVDILSKFDDDDFIKRYVSGKDHLLPLLLTRMRKITKLRCTNDTYKVRLAKKSKPDDFQAIVDLYEELYV